MRLKKYLLFLLLCFGCDNANISLTKPSELYFSMYGFLDVKADTQFVRISPLREVPSSLPQKIDASVELRDLDSGEKIAMKDSLFKFEGQFYVHNFWTTHKIRENGRYQLRATNSEGKSSIANIEVPNAAPVVQLANPWSLRAPNLEVPQHIYVQGAYKLLHVRLRYALRPSSQGSTGQLRTQSYLWLPQAENGVFDVFSDGPKHIKEIAGNTKVSSEDFQVDKIWVDIFGTNQDIPSGYTLEEYAQINTTNVQNGLGYVIGTISYHTEWQDLRNYLNQWLRTRIQWRF